MKHTPGPWAFQPHTRMINHLLFDEPKDHRNCIATIPNENPESIANGRLIAAAPALLSGCEAALAYLADPPSKFKENRDKAVEIIRDAINQATQEIYRSGDANSQAKPIKQNLKLIVFQEGGVIHQILGNDEALEEIEIHLLDYDLEGVDDDSTTINFSEGHSNEMYHIHHHIDYDPDFFDLNPDL